MVYTLIRSYLGNWGGAVLDFYSANSLWINVCLLLYALLVFLGRRNYRLIAFSLTNGLYSKYKTQLDKKNRKQLGAVLKRLEVPWDESLKVSRFPFVTPPGGLRLYLKNTKTLRNLFPDEKLLDALVERSK
jgi:hypothetical protein